jgi:hypothetical protein
VAAVRSGLDVPGRSPRVEPAGARDSRLSRYFLLWILAAPLVGFALAGRVFRLGADGRWELWKAALLGILMMAPFVVGAYFGLRSVRRGFRGGWAGLAANTVLAALAIGMPLSESLTG